MADNIVLGMTHIIIHVNARDVCLSKKNEHLFKTKLWMEPVNGGEIHRSQTYRFKLQIVNEGKQWKQ